MNQTIEPRPVVYTRTEQVDWRAYEEFREIIIRTPIPELHRTLEIVITRQYA